MLEEETVLLCLDIKGPVKGTATLRVVFDQKGLKVSLENKIPEPTIFATS